MNKLLKLLILTVSVLTLSIAHVDAYTYEYTVYSDFGILGDPDDPSVMWYDTHHVGFDFIGSLAYTTSTPISGSECYDHHQTWTYEGHTFIVHNIARLYPYGDVFEPRAQTVIVIPINPDIPQLIANPSPELMSATAIVTPSRIYYSDGGNQSAVLPLESSICSIAGGRVSVEVWPESSALNAAKIRENSRNITWHCLLFNSSNALYKVDGDIEAFAITPEWRRQSEDYGEGG